MELRLRRHVVGSIVLTGLLATGAGAAEPRPDHGSDVRILYDNSGSMFPGYAPQGGTPRSASGARYFREYPEFRAWLRDFVHGQTLLDRDARVELYGFTSRGPWATSDLLQIHAPVAAAQLDPGTALDRLPPPGNTTHLAEALEQGSRGFEGLIWLVTDNIVDTGSGSPEASVKRFFEALKNGPRYRSLNLYAFPFTDKTSGQSSTLAIYAILVSDEQPDEAALGALDRKFRTSFKRATRPDGSRLFPGQEHRKFKDLGVDSLESEVEVALEPRNMGLFGEDQPVRLHVRATIRSHLTQHAVTSGRYTLALSGFAPEAHARRELGLRPIPATEFPSATGSLREIPPNGIGSITHEIVSRHAQRLRTVGMGAWLRLAAGNVAVPYRGAVKITLSDIKLTLKEDRLAGVYGISAAAEVFKQTLDARSIKPQTRNAPAKFSVVAGNQRALLLLLLLLIAVAPVGVAVYALGRRRYYRVTLADQPPFTVALRRLSGKDLSYLTHRVGRLSRGLAGGHVFRPATGQAAFTVVATSQPDVYDINLRAGSSARLVIEPLDDRHASGPRAPSRRSASWRGANALRPAQPGDRRASGSPNPTASPGAGSRGAPGAPGRRRVPRRP